MRRISGTAKIDGINRQTQRDWVHRFNVKAPGQWQAIESCSEAVTDQKQALMALFEAGSGVEWDGLVRWRRIDLKPVIRERFGVYDRQR